MRRLLLAVLCLLLFTLPVWGAEAENTMEVTAVVNGDGSCRMAVKLVLNLDGPERLVLPVGSGAQDATVNGAAAKVQRLDNIQALVLESPAGFRGVQTFTLTYTLPAYQTACGAADMMLHTMERYFTQGESLEITDSIAEGLLRTVMAQAVILRDDPKNYNARAEVMWAGSLSHNHLTGLGRDGDWATHQIEHELGGMYDVAHGAGLAAVWPSWARYVCRQDLLRFARFGANVWGIPLNYEHPEETAAAAIAQTERFFTSIGMPVTLTELLGRTPEEKELRELAVKCTFFGARKIGGLMKLGEQEIFEIYQSAL